ncbi:MAG: WbqC family protein [Leeuwenhoekiella sp.]
MNRVLVQPTYLPTIIQSAIMLKAGAVILEVHDNYQKQSYRNRTHIATANGQLTLNIPVKHVGKDQGHQKTKDARIENNFLWQRQHWRSIEIAYRTSPFFEYYEDDFAFLYTTSFEKLIDFNIASIKAVFNALQVDIKTLNSTDYKTKAEIEDAEIKDFRFLADAKRKEELQIVNYRQVFQEKHNFIPNLSVIDLIFNEGPNAATYLENLNF